MLEDLEHYCGHQNCFQEFNSQKNCTLEIMLGFEK